ncbi:hypothetical protein ACIGEZ_11195 [Streptomyces sp. NPDC085481]|uniref:hypothetical protein n=1 Tax=Streptomyces sp. NPDC085481 TaxID=3365727 RepID=UPI0037D790AD
MADERYPWLDQEAAERLLRGETVDPADDTARAQARLLARALDAARTPAAVLGPDGELPGEAAALAAFRKMTAERAAEAAAVALAAGSAGRATTAELGAVRLAPVSAGRSWGRSLRYGLAAALAAVTVGGVAVAAGTGMLPMTGEPATGSSVTAVDTPDPVASESPSGGTGTVVPTVPRERDGQTATPGTTDGPATATAGPGGKDGATPEPSASTLGKDGKGDIDRSGAVKACQEFRAGKLADGGRKRLANVLKSGETVKRYCDRILAGTPDAGSTSAGRTPSGGGSGNTNSGSDSGKSSGGSDGDDKGDRGGDHHGHDGKGGNGGKAGDDRYDGDGRTGDKGDEHRKNGDGSGQDRPRR